MLSIFLPSWLMLLWVSKASKIGDALPTEDCFRYEDPGELTNWQILEPFAATTTMTI